MLNTLDTVIAFAVIMTVLSLLITIIVQMVSTALSLRGKNLANALALTFQTIDPKVGEHAHSLAAQILRDPIFSDSILRPKNREQVPQILLGSKAQALIDAERKLKRAEEELRSDPENADKKAAVTTTKEGVTNAKSSLTEANDKLKAAEQQLAADPKNLQKQSAVEDAVSKVKQAKADLQIRDVEPNRTEQWSAFSLFKLWDATALGSAIRPGEIYRLLHEFAELTETEAGLRDIPPDVVKTSVDLIGCLKDPDQPTKESKEKLETIRQVAGIFSTSEQQKAVLDSLASFGVTVERATTEAYDRFQRWFGSAQDRAEQWFQTHVRVVTIVCSICAAFILQLDIAEIYRQLRDQPKLVEALVKSAPGVLEQGSKIVEPSDTPAYHAYLLWLRDHPLFPLANLPTPADQSHYAQSLEKRLSEEADTKSPLTKFAEDYQKAATVEGAAKPTPDTIAKAAYESWVEKFPKYQLPADYDFTKATKDSVTKDIRELVAKDPDNKPNPQTLLQDYAGLKTEGVYAYERAQKKNFTDLQKKLDEAGFDYIPTPFWGRWQAEHLPLWTNWCVLHFVPRYFFHVCWHLLGILATAGLLALGAPFWFNLLKNLMSLRPAVATLIEKRPTSAPALPAAPATPPSPS